MIWPGPKRTNVIVRDEADGIDKLCYVWNVHRDGTVNATGQMYAALCERTWVNGHPECSGKVVLQVAPKDGRYGYLIEKAEILEPAREVPA